MGTAAHHNGGTGCESSVLLMLCRSYHRRDTSPDSLGEKNVIVKDKLDVIPVKCHLYNVINVDYW